LKKKTNHWSVATTETPSPRSKTRKLLQHLARNTKQKSAVVKTLNFHYALLSSIREKYRKTKSERDKQKVWRYFCGKIMRKYKMMKIAEE